MGKHPDGTPSKKPPAPSVKKRAAARPKVKAQIVGEIQKVLKRLYVDEELLAIIGSWRDTLDDAEVLALLRDHNAGRPTLHRMQ